MAICREVKHHDEVNQQCSKDHEEVVPGKVFDRRKQRAPHNITCKNQCRQKAESTASGRWPIPGHDGRHDPGNAKNRICGKAVNQLRPSNEGLKRTDPDNKQNDEEVTQGEKTAAQRARTEKG